MYNEKLKKQYLDTIFDKGTMSNIKHVLENVSIVEEDYKNDVFNFNAKQIDEVLYIFDAANPNVLIKNWSIVETYINWVIASGYRTYNLSLPKLSNEDFYKYIRIPKAKAMYIKDDYHLWQILNKITNFQDKLLILLPYYGVSGNRMEEMLTLPKDYCRNNTIIVERNGLPFGITVPDDIFEIIEQAKRENQYVSRNGTSQSRCKSRQLLDSDYLVRMTTIKKDNQKDTMSYGGYCAKMEKIPVWVDMPHMTGISILHSGMYNAIKKFEKVNEEVSIQDYKRIFEQFNMDFSNYSQMKFNYFNFFDWLWEQE